MSKQAFERANETFIDDNYDEAYKLYTEAITSDDKTDHQYTSNLLATRAQCAIKLRKYNEALDDSTNAIELDRTNSKAYLRKGIALYNQNLIEEASKTFLSGLEIDSGNDQLKIWAEKCEKELQG